MSYVFCYLYVRMHIKYKMNDEIDINEGNIFLKSYKYVAYNLKETGTENDNLLCSKTTRLVK